MRRCLVAALAVLVLVTGCAGDETGDAAVDPDAVVVASFNFTESDLVAELYAQALEAEGVTVRRERALGQRELVLPALRRGLVDVVPEYAGSALDAIAPGAVADRSAVDEVVRALRDAVAPWGLRVLTPATASNQNVVAVTAEVAAERRLRSISDLGPAASSLVLGGPPECPRRPRCIPGLAERYGLEFRSFVPLDGSDLVRRALVDGVVDVGVLFSTDAGLDADLVVLDDDRRLQPPDNIVPVVRAAVLDDERVRPALDRVSRHLTTRSLRVVNWRLANVGSSVTAEARGWLVRRGLVPR